MTNTTTSGHGAILTIVDGSVDAPSADTLSNITRADVRADTIRLFAGRTKVAAIALTELGDPAPKADTVAGILAALTFPTSEVAIRDHLEVALHEASVRTGSVIPDHYRFGYGEDQNNGDALALAFKAYCGGGLKEPMDMAKLEEVVDTNGIRDRFDVWMAKDLNPGMLRMNTGNVLRGKFRKGDPVRIGERVWNEATPAA